MTPKKILCWQEKFLVRVNNQKDLTIILYTKIIINFIYIYIFIGKNNLGIKTGNGFFNYSSLELCNDKYNYEDIKRDLYIGLIEASLILLSDGVLEKNAINKAWTYGTNLQKSPFDILDEIGIEKFKMYYQKWIEQEYTSNKSYKLVLDVISNLK